MEPNMAQSATRFTIHPLSSSHSHSHPTSKNIVNFVSYSSKYQKLIECSYLDWYYKVSFLISANCVFGTDKWAQPNTNKHKTSMNKHKMHKWVQIKAKWAPNKCEWAQTGAKLGWTSMKCTNECKSKLDKHKTNVNEPKWAQNKHARKSANESWMCPNKPKTSMDEYKWKFKVKWAGTDEQGDKRIIVWMNKYGQAWMRANKGQTSVTGTTKWCKWMGTTRD